MSQDLSGKVALVTGANSGIGKAAAPLFARRGARVAVAARRVPELESLVQEIEAFGGSAAAFPTDVSREDQVDALVADVVNRFGRVDMAFNNAGVMGKWSVTGEQTPEGSAWQGGGPLPPHHSGFRLCRWIDEALVRIACCGVTHPCP